MKHKHLKSSNHDIYAKLQISSKKARSIRWLDKKIDKMINRKTDKMINRKIDKMINRKTDKMINRKIEER